MNVPARRSTDDTVPVTESMAGVYKSEEYESVAIWKGSSCCHDSTLVRVAKLKEFRTNLHNLARQGSVRGHVA
jgi:hypothetical protein